MNTDVIQGTYGSQYTPCLIYIAENSDGSKWYAVSGSVNVNCTYDDISDGVDVETLADHDTFTAGESIYTESDLIEAVES